MPAVGKFKAPSTADIVIKRLVQVIVLAVVVQMAWETDWKRALDFSSSGAPAAAGGKAGAGSTEPPHKASSSSGSSSSSRARRQGGKTTSAGAQDKNKSNKKNKKKKVDDRDLAPGQAAFEKGMRRARQGFEREARSLLQESADAGFPPALFEMSFLHEDDITERKAWLEKAMAKDYVPAFNAMGDLLVQNAKSREEFRDARVVFKKAADRGDTEAMMKLASLLAQGKGGRRSRKTTEAAYQWTRVAAEKGDVNAMFMLAVSLRDGQGCEPDEAEATTWFRKAAEAGDPEAMFLLARNYHTGQGVEKPDIVEAEKWLKRAGDAGHIEARKKLNKYYKGKEKVDELTAAQKHRLKLAEDGDMMSQLAVGAGYMNGLDGFPIDEKKGVDWLRKAAEQGDGTAAHLLAIAYDSGVPGKVQRDIVEAHKWRQMAREHGYEDPDVEVERERATRERERLKKQKQQRAGSPPETEQ